MARASSQPFIWVGITAALVVMAVVALQVVDRSPGPVATDAAVGAALVEPAHDAARAPVAIVPAPALDAALPASRPIRNRGVDAFREQSEEDQRRLGGMFADMERLWKLGRFGGAGPAAKQALEELVDKYGETNRAACARYLLAKQAMGSAPADRVKQLPDATRKLEQVVESSPDARCDNGARAASLSKLLLATFVYRHDDYDRALRSLRELAAIDPDETDNLGVPIALRARAILTEAGQADPSWPKPPLDAAGVQLH